MSILSDKWIDQVTLKLCEEYPLLDFSFQDGYTEELKLILEAAYRETLEMVGKIAKREAVTILDSYGKEYWVVDYDDFIGALNKLEVSNWWKSLKLGTFKEGE